MCYKNVVRFVEKQHLCLRKTTLKRTKQFIYADLPQEDLVFVTIKELHTVLQALSFLVSTQKSRNTKYTIRVLKKGILEKNVVIARIHPVEWTLVLEKKNRQLYRQ